MPSGDIKHAEVGIETVSRDEADMAKLGLKQETRVSPDQ